MICKSHSNQHIGIIIIINYYNNYVMKFLFYFAEADDSRLYNQNYNSNILINNLWKYTRYVIK